MRVKPVYTWTFEKQKPADSGWVEVYYQVGTEKGIKVYIDKGEGKGLEEVTSTFDKGWGVSNVSAHYKKLKPNDAHKIHTQIDALEQKAQTPEPTPPKPTQVDAQSEDVQIPVRRAPEITSQISPR